MAKQESFFIRATVTPDDSGNFVQTAVDLSSYVNALGKSILKIRAIEGEWCQGPTGAIPNGAPKMDAGVSGEAVWQLTTQSNTGLVSLDDRTTIAKGMQAPVLQATIPCQKCGNQNPIGTNFCGNCGNKLGSLKLVKCPKCKTENPSEMKFCGNCGTKMKQADVECSKCKTKNKAGSKFCGNCGNKL